jgi:hypothetical protein
MSLDERLRGVRQQTHRIIKTSTTSLERPEILRRSAEVCWDKRDAGFEPQKA